MKEITIKVLANTILTPIQIKNRICSVFFDTKMVDVQIKEYSPFCTGCDNPNCKDCFNYD